MIYVALFVLFAVACDKDEPFSCSLVDISVESISSESATLMATINASDYGKIERMGFCLRRQGAAEYDWLNADISREVSLRVDGLKPATNYEYMLFVFAADDSWTFKQQSFRTLAVEEQPDTPDTPDDPDDPDTPDNPDDGGDDTPVSGKAYRAAWYELPEECDTNGDGVDENNDTYYYAHHLCTGGERNAQRTAAARNFSVCFSSKHHCPLWVAAPRHAMYEGDVNRTNAYAHDPQIPVNIQYVRKDADSGCNNGHLLGSAERTSTTETNRQVFYFSNIAPQYSDTFNTGGGAWNNLEEHIDKLVCRDTLYMVIGCYFDSYTDAYGNRSTPKKISFGGRSDVSCPTMFYYALLRTKSGATGKSVAECSAEELQCAAFVLSHEQDKGHKPQAKDLMTIEQLEKITGFKYFVNVPNAPTNELNSSDWL